MRTLSLVAGIIAVGTLAALPFRRTEVVVDPESPATIATGPLGRQVESDAINGVLQWPDRPGFDPSLAWQPKPMTMETPSHAFELPKMPEAFPTDAMQMPMPAPIRDRFKAAVPIPDPASTDQFGNQRSIGSNGLLMPQVAHIEDRFVYSPPPRPEPRPRLEPASRSEPMTAGAHAGQGDALGATPRQSAFHSASVIRSDSAISTTPSDRQYIREPQ
jgi:hypothetical protein